MSTTNTPTRCGGSPACSCGQGCNAADLERAAQHRTLVEQLAGGLLDAVTVAHPWIGGDPDDPLGSAFRWLVRVAEERGLIEPSPITDLAPPRNPEPGEFDRWRRRLPVRGYVVYVLVDGVGQALYVGQTRAPRSRIRSHWRSQPWWPEVADIELHPVADELAARILEQRLTEEMRPLHSKVTPSEARLLELMRAAAMVES